jgi:hypothetical protein
MAGRLRQSHAYQSFTIWHSVGKPFYITLQKTIFMKHIATLFATIIILLAFNSSFAQTTYNINDNKSWTSTYNSYYMSDARFVIASGKTLTLDQAWATAANCTFTGGTVAITQNFSLQGCTFSNCKLVITAAVSIQSNKTTFTNVTGTISGSGSITASTQLAFTSSVFTFSGSTGFTAFSQVDLYSSTLNFYGNSFLLSTGTDNLWSGSHLVAGDGTAASSARLFFNGGTLNLEDAASTFALANSNNYYFNWGSYNSISNNKSYAANSGINCGTTGKNNCQNPYTYGPATAGANGITAGFSSLPVVLTGFTAAVSAKNAVDLSWTTQQEINSAYFIIERSADGAQWQAIGTVAAKGNSSVSTAYAYTDIAPLTGVNYYRLKMADQDGAYTYSSVNTIRTTLVKEISFFPNPATNYVNISLGGTTASDMNVQLVNLSGQIVLEQKVTAGTSGIVTLPVQQLTRGMYVLNMATAGGVQQTGKILINH